VKFGYYIQWKHQFGPRAKQLALPGGSAINWVWNIMWKLKVPSKIRIFGWQALHGIIPFKCILVNRHIGQSGACPICDQGAEDVLHVLFTCPEVQEMWRELGLLDIISHATLVDRAGSGVLEFLLRLPDNSMPGFTSLKLQESVVVMCWYLWWLTR
jgi:hypothetical protein